MFARLLRNLARNWTQPASPRPGASAGRHRYRPTFDRLEDRTVPALNLNTDVFGSLLVITDTDLFDGASTNAQATLTFNAGQVTLTGNGGTTIEGGANQSFFGINAVIFEAGGGNDTLTVNGVVMSGFLTMVGRDGNDSLILTGNNTIGGHILFLGGDGDNTFAMNMGNNIVFGVVDIVNGDGRQTVNIATSTNDSAIVGALFIHNGVNANVGGGGNTLNIGSGGVGANFTAFGPVLFIEHGATTANSNVLIHTTGTSFIGGDVIVDTAAGGDGVTINNTSIRGHLIVVTHANNDQLNLSFTNVIQGNVVFLGGDGNNLFNQSFGDLLVFGFVEIVNGTGNQTVSVGTVANDHVTIQRGLFIHNGTNISATANGVVLGAGGAGTQFVRIGGPMIYVDFGVHTANTNIDINGPLNVGAFMDVFTDAGNDAIRFNAAATINGPVLIVTRAGNDTIIGTVFPTVTGHVRIFTEAGDDTVVLTGTFGASILVDAGLGNDTVRFGSNATATVALATSVQGPVTVFLGDGANTLSVNDTTFNGFVSFFGGTGVDLVLVEKINSGVQTRFNSGVFGFLGDSDDTVDVGLTGDANDGAIFADSVFLDGGLGLNDALFVGANIFGVGNVRPGNVVLNPALVTVINFENFTTV